MSEREPQDKWVTLPVRVRTTVRPDEEASLARTVRCPARRESLSMVVCEFCARCEAIVVDRDGGPSQVVCRTRPEAACDHAQRVRLPSAADRTPISAVMSSKVMCVSGSVSAEALAQLFLERHIGAAPVVDDDGAPIGVVSKTDLMRHQRVDEGARATAHDLMMPFAFTLLEDEPLSRAAAVMAVEDVHHLPVVGADGRVVGMISSQDLVRFIARESGYLK
jgi:CBS domain-containing protein